MSRRTITADDLLFGEARTLRTLRRRIMSAMAEAGDLEGMTRARDALVDEFKAAHKGDAQLCAAADTIARVVC